MLVPCISLIIIFDRLNENSKVAIIGAGPAGLSAAKHLLAAGVSKVTIYEKSDEIGGVWRYTDTPDHPHATPVYDSLKINIPAGMIVNTAKIAFILFTTCSTTSS